MFSTRSLGLLWSLLVTSEAENYNRTLKVASKSCRIVVTLGNQGVAGKVGKFSGCPGRDKKEVLAIFCGRRGYQVGVGLTVFLRGKNGKFLSRKERLEKPFNPLAFSVFARLIVRFLFHCIDSPDGVWPLEACPELRDNHYLSCSHSAIS